MELLSTSSQQQPCAPKLCIYVWGCDRSRLLTLGAETQPHTKPAQSSPAFLCVGRINCNPFALLVAAPGVSLSGALSLFCLWGWEIVSLVKFGVPIV